MDAYNDVMALVNAVMFGLSTVYIIFVMLKAGNPGAWFMLVFFGSAFLFFSFLAWLRLGAGYVGPSVAMTIASNFVYATAWAGLLVAVAIEFFINGGNKGP